MLSDYKPLLKNRNFTLLWSSQLLSQVTIFMINFLFLFRLFELTGSSFATSMLWIAYAMPAILIGPFAAVVVDMVDKKKLLMITNFFQATTIFIFSFFTGMSILPLYIVAFTYSFLNQFYVPSEQSALPTLVKKNNLSHANGLFFLTQQSAIVIGLSIVGPISTLIGFEKTLLLCSAFLYLAFLTVSFLPKMVIDTSFSFILKKLIINFIRKIAEGYKAIIYDKFILAPFVLLLWLQVIVAIITVNAPVITQDIFKLPISLAGVALVVPTGIGAVTAAIIIPKRLKSGVRKINIIKNSLAFLITGLIFVIFIIPQLIDLYRMILSFLTLVFIGFLFVSIFIPTQTMLQEKTPEKFRGRVFGNYWFIVTIATVLPILLSATIIEIFGIKILLFFISFTLMFLYFLLNSKKSISPSFFGR